jgi:hypothetical protein
VIDWVYFFELADILFYYSCVCYYYYHCVIRIAIVCRGVLLWLLFYLVLFPAFTMLFLMVVNLQARIIVAFSVYIPVYNHCKNKFRFTH